MPRQRLRQVRGQRGDERALRDVRRDEDQYAIAAIFGLAVGPADARPGEGLPERLVHPVAHGYLMGVGPGRIAEVLDIDDQDGAVDSWRQHLRS